MHPIQRPKDATLDLLRMKTRVNEAHLVLAVSLFMKVRQIDPVGVDAVSERLAAGVHKRRGSSLDFDGDRFNFAREVPANVSDAHDVNEDDVSWLSIEDGSDRPAEVTPVSPFLSGRACTAETTRGRFDPMWFRGHLNDLGGWAQPLCGGEMSWLPIRQSFRSLPFKEKRVNGRPQP